MQPQPFVTSRAWIVIVNYRTASLTVECLRSLVCQINDLSGGRVVVVDNASADGSVEQIAAAIAREGWSDWAGVVPLDRNGGFAFGNNAGIRLALAATNPAEYVLLLNPDTVVQPGALGPLVAFMDAHPEVGIAGSRLENAEGGVDCSAHRKPSPLGELIASARFSIVSRLLAPYSVSPPIRSETHECDWVSGASMVIRRKVLETIGPMDEGFFLYFEEVDFCCRARVAGWSVWYVPESRVIHLEGAATGIRVAGRRREPYWYDSRRRFYIRYYGLAGLALTDLFWVSGRLIYLFRSFLYIEGNTRQTPKFFTFDLIWGDLRAVLSGRARNIGRAGVRR